MPSLRITFQISTLAAAFAACSSDDVKPIEPGGNERGTGPVLQAKELWKDVTKTAIPGGTLANGWTHKLELTDLDNDGRVDLLFANGPAYSNAQFSQPQKSQIYLNDGNTNGTPKFKELTAEPFGFTGFVRAIKARDVNDDGHLDIFFGTTHHAGASRLFLGKGSGKFENVSATHLPKDTTAMGDADIGDVDGDGDLDIVIANWGKGEPCVSKVPGCPNKVLGSSPGGKVLLWLNDGTGKFTDGTADRMPATLVKFSWDLEFVDIDNDMDLDLAVASKATLGEEGSFLYENDGTGKFTDVSQKRLPQFPNNYEFEIIDFNKDGALDLLTFNDGASQSGEKFDLREHIFINDGDGKYTDQTSALWPNESNIGEDDNHGAVFDFDSDGDADFLIGSLFGNQGAQSGNGHERLMINDQSKSIQMMPEVLIAKGTADLAATQTPGTLGIAVADLNGDSRPDVVQSQGESAFDERVYVATNDIPKDTQAPIIALPETTKIADQSVQVRVSIYDNKTPVADSDFLFKNGARELPFVQIKHPARARFEKSKTPLKWYGGTLWRADVDISAAILKKEAVIYRVCATDAAGNQSCEESQPIAIE